jgi:hypothetical protein
VPSFGPSRAVLPCSLALTSSIVFERVCGASKELLAHAAGSVENTFQFSMDIPGPREGSDGQI